LSKAGSREDVDEDIFEVCCQFLDERISRGGVDGRGADHVNHEGEEEERKLHDEYCAGRDYEQLRADAEWNDDGFYDFVRYHYDADGSRRA
jgi:hypothetical protein